MTSAELLARLAQRPPVPVPAKSVIAMPQFYAMTAARAEFDRALLLDAVEYLETAQLTAHRSAWRGEYSDPWYKQAWIEAEDAAAALRTIVTELRSNP